MIIPRIGKRISDYLFKVIKMDKKIIDILSKLKEKNPKMRIYVGEVVES